MNIFYGILASAICGVLSGFGIGGGSLLLIYMTTFASIQQNIAQGINLIYFILTSAAALVFHIKNKLIEKKIIFYAAVPGCITALLSSLAATVIDTQILKRFFGIFLLFIGLSQLFKRKSSK